MHSSAISLITLIACLSCSSQNERPPSNLQQILPSFALAIDSIGQSYLDAGGVKGISVSVAKYGEVIYNQGFGFIDSANTIPVGGDSYFLMASISKLVTATMVMKLAEEGKLTLASTLREVLPDYPNEEHAKKITIYHLLTHTSGLRDYAEVLDTIYIETGIAPTKQDYYDYFRSTPIDFEPGTNFNYSNSGFALAAMIIEAVTGHSFEEELERIVNKPTGLDLKPIADRVDDPAMTALFEVNDSALACVPHWTWFKGDGGLTATSKDLAQFPHYWSNGTIISRESFRQMCTSAILHDGVRTGYGLGVRTGRFEGEYCIGHTGGNQSTMALMKYYPDLNTSVVVMVNTDNSPGDALTIEGFASLAALGKEIPDLAAMEVAGIDYSNYPGTYASIGNVYYGQKSISIVQYPDDPHLYMKITGSDSKGQKLYCLAKDTFAYEKYPMDRIIFEADSSGKISAYNNYLNGLRKGGVYRKTDE